MMTALTNAATHVVLVAQQEAHRQNARSVKAEHLLIALTVVQSSCAGSLLRRLGCQVAQLRALVFAYGTPPSKEMTISDVLPLSPELEQSIDEQVKGLRRSVTTCELLRAAVPLTPVPDVLSEFRLSPEQVVAALDQLHDECQAEH